MRQGDFGEQWAEADAADAAVRAENRAYLIGALARVRASSDLRIFVSAVYRHAGDSIGKCWWSVTIRQVCGVDSAAATLIDPLTEVLGCSYGQAKRVAGRARSLGLVRTRPKHGYESRDSDPDRHPGQQWEYQIDWAGVRRLVGLDRALERAQDAPARAQGAPARAQGAPARAQGAPAPYKEDACACRPVPVPVRAFETSERNGTGTGACATRPRLLDSVTRGTLQAPRELLDVFCAVCEVSPISGLTWCDADRLFVLSAAACALRVEAARRDGKDPMRNVVAFWRWIVSSGQRGYPSAKDGDLAAEQYRQWEASRREAEGRREEIAEGRLACQT